MSWSTALRLGRISNLPTVWTNVLAGAVLTGSSLPLLPLALVLLALSLFYIAGMYLNDAFDRQFDKSAYPQRPIPSGAVKAETVFTMGFMGLGAGELLLIAVSYGAEGSPGWPPAIAGFSLCATIILYNMRHKGNPLGPFLMGLCRAQVYLIAALTVSPTLSQPVWWGMVLVVAYIMGLSYVARQETLARLMSLWPLALLAVPFIYGAAGAMDNERAALIYTGFLLWIITAVLQIARHTGADIKMGVSRLIAGIAFLDALLIALAGNPPLATVAVAGAVLTRLAHRIVPGT